MSDAENINQTHNFDLLGKTCIYYGLAFVGFGVGSAIVFSIHASLYSLVIYLLMGYMLNRMILRQIAWHPLSNNLREISKAKIVSLILWPLTYLFLIARLAVMKFL